MPNFWKRFCLKVSVGSPRRMSGTWNQLGLLQARCAKKPWWRPQNASLIAASSAKTRLTWNQAISILLGHVACIQMTWPPSKSVATSSKVDTASWITEVTCAGCKVCGKHINPHFDVARTHTLWKELRCSFLLCSKTQLLQHATKTHEMGLQTKRYPKKCPKPEKRYLSRSC